VKLILNRVPRRLDITPAELEKMLGLPIFCMIANDYPELYESYAEGRLLARSSSLGKHMVRLATKLSGIEEGKEEKKGLGRLFGRD
jgi:Flp pilus assembly CpaE family ATPase